MLGSSDVYLKLENPSKKHFFVMKNLNLKKMFGRAVCSNSNVYKKHQETLASDKQVVIKQV